MQFLRPYFTILHDESNKCIVVLIRGARSFKDRLTAATAAVVPFHHLVIREGNLCNLVLGHAHCGMLAAARWIVKSVTPCLLRAISQNPDYHIKVKHSYFHFTYDALIHEPVLQIKHIWCILYLFLLLLFLLVRF